MDVTANVIAIVDLAFKVIKYMNDVNEGGKERSSLHQHAVTVYELMLSLKYDFESHSLSEESTWSRPIKPLFKPGGTIDQLKRVLEEITSKIVIASRSVRGTAKKLKWPFDKDEVQNILTRLRLSTDSISVALGRANLEVGIDTNRDVKTVRHAIESAELETAMKWISPLDFREMQKAAQRRPLDGTCKWFFDNLQVHGWSESRSKSLWCHGIPGAGKTVLATALFQKLLETHANENVAVLIAYCSFDDANTHSVSNIISSFLRQVVEKRGQMSESVRKLYKEHTSGDRGRPTQESLSSTLSEELATFDTAFVILDGLDELRDNKAKTELLRAVESLQPLPQLLVTSRPVEAISTWFKESAREDGYRVRSRFGEEEYSRYYCDNCDERDEYSDAENEKTATDFEIIEADEGDVAWTGEHRTPTSPASYQCVNCKRDVCIGCYDQFDRCFGCNGLKQECFQWAWPGTVTIAADLEDLERYILWRIDNNDNLRALLGNARAQAFGLAETIVQRVQEESHKMFLLAKFHMNALEEQVTARELINALDTLPSNINDIYNSVFSRISSQRLAATLEKLLIIIATAQMLLPAEALAHAITIQPGDTDIDELALPDVRHLASMCAGLIEIDSTGSVRLAHETIGGYIAQTGLRSSKSGHGILAEICLAYLQFSAFSAGACDGPARETLLQERQQRYPLLRYAAIHWGTHVRHAHTHLPEFLRTDVLSQLTKEFLSKKGHVAAATQLMWLDGLEASSGWDAEEGVDGLHLGAHFGLSAATSAFLATGSDVDVEDCLSTTPLMYAAQAGHAEIVHILLHSGADPSRICRRGRTALNRAVVINDMAVVKEIIASRRDIAINAFDRGSYASTALMWATAQGNEEIVKLLLTRDDIDINLRIPDTYQSNALHWAVIDDQLGIAELFLADSRTEIETADSSRRTALMLAAELGHGEMLSLLLRCGANTDARDIYDGPPLLRAVDKNSLECVRLLVEYGVDYKFKDFLGRGILHGCAINARSTIMRYLLKALPDLDPNVQGDSGETPLHDAVTRNSEATVRVLLEHGARTDIENKHGKTPLRMARDGDLERLFDLLRAARMKEIEPADSQSQLALGDSDAVGHPKRANTLAVDYKMSIETAVRKLSAEGLRSYLAEMGPQNASELIKDTTRELPHLAVRYGRTDNLGILLDMSADIHKRDEWGFTPLHAAIDFENYTAAEVLLDRGCDIDARDLLNRTPLTFCTSQDLKPAFAFLLLKRGATFDVSERDGLVPTLRYAVECDEFEIVRILVEGGVPFRMKDRRDQTPYQQAKRAGYEKIAQYLYEQARQEKSRPKDSAIDQTDHPVKPQTAVHLSECEDQSQPTNLKDANAQVFPDVPLKDSKPPSLPIKSELETSDPQTSVTKGQITPAHGGLGMLTLTQREMVLLAIILSLIIVQFYK
ncbi:ankyrin [Xylariaceae sp. FL1272]|nr:ankyrin [Xylariaceae sp. FL1272]